MDTAAKMQLFENLVYVSIAIAVVGLGLAVFFFFFFDIPNVYALMTGKAKRKTIERMAEQNSRTGRLQSAVSGGLRDPSAPVVQHPSNVITAQMHTTPDMQDNVSNNSVQETTILGASAETTVLGGVADTTVLNAPTSEAGETAVLAKSAPAERVPAEPKIRFEIIENTLVIHTNEIL